MIRRRRWSLWRRRVALAAGLSLILAGRIGSFL
jgi:hypothetical protein